MKNFLKVAYYIWQKLKNYKIAFFSTFLLFGIMVIVTDAIIPLHIKDLTDSLNLNDIKSTQNIMVILIVLYILSRVLFFISMHLLSWFEIRVSEALNDFSFENFTKHSYHFYTNEFTGSLVEKSARLGVNVIDIIDNLIFNFYSLLISVVSIFIILFHENMKIAIYFVCFLFVYLILTYWISKKIGPVYEERSRERSNFRAITSDVITNIHTILFFGNRNHDLKKYEKANNEFHQKQYKAWVTTINYQESLGLLPPLFTVGITFYAVYLANLGMLSTGSVILIFLMGNNLNSQVWRLSGSSKRLVSNISDCAEAIEIIEKESEVKDVEYPQKTNIIDGEISFKDIDFTYPEGEEVFKNFNLIIPKGQSIGIVGKSGSGKSTLTKLLLRLYDIQDGTITIDSQDISQVKQEELRKHIAYVPQETILFHRSIWDNIHYGNLKAQKREVKEAAQLAHVEEFVKELEDQYKTLVGERGIKLSGGQRQRIGIARAMLKKEAPILLMDEATSSLDSLSEQFIQDSFLKLSQNRTTIVIAHRLSTIQKMDRIIVMEKGNIIEDGSHEELLNKNGHYAELWNSQVDGFITE